MPVEITREHAPVSSIVVTDTKGHRCVKIMPVVDGATFEHDAEHMISAAFLDVTALRSLADALIDIALAAETRIVASAFARTSAASGKTT